MILTQIPPEHLHIVPHRATFDILQAMRHGNGERNIADIMESIHKGENQIWIQWDDDDNHIATVVTRVTHFDRKKVCVVEYCGGVHNSVVNYFDQLQAVEDWAAHNGCDEVRVIGRRGWLRALKEQGFNEQYTIIGKRLK